MRKKNISRSLFAFSSLGLQLAIFMVVFVYAGYKLDNYYQTGPWLVLLGAFLGITAGLYTLIKGLQQIDRESKKQENENNNKKWL